MFKNSVISNKINVYAELILIFELNFFWKKFKKMASKYLQNNDEFYLI